MSYENAPATVMLATHCAVCSRPLVDSVSVEAGIGPDCRERHGYNVEVPAEARAEANKLVHAIAVGADPSMLPVHIAALRVYGFDKLADIIITRRASIRLTEELVEHHPMLAIETPYDEAFVADLKRQIFNRRKWDREAKVWLIANTQHDKNTLWACLKRHFKGALGVSPRGLFTVQ